MKNVNDGTPSTYTEASILYRKIERAMKLYNAVRKAHRAYEAYGGTKTLQGVLASFERFGAWETEDIRIVSVWLSNASHTKNMFIRGCAALVTLERVTNDIWAATAQHAGVKVGDIIYDPSTDQRYRISVIDYYLDPPDMFLAELYLL